MDGLQKSVLKYRLASPTGNVTHQIGAREAFFFPKCWLSKVHRQTHEQEKNLQKKKSQGEEREILTSRVKPFVASAHKVTSVPSRMRDGGRDGVEEEEGRKAKKKKETAVIYYLA